jgi:Skp family chaperone for outer membrane proteins
MALAPHHERIRIMTRILLAAFLLAVCTTAATPQIKVPDTNFQNQKSPLKITSRVAIVHVALVMDKNEKAVQFKKEIQVIRAPFNKQMQALRDNIAKWQTSIDELDFARASKTDLEAKIETAQAQVKKLKDDCEAVTEKKKSEALPGLWKDMQDAIKTMAAENKIDMVLGYGDAMDERSRNLLPTAENLFPAINRKMQAMDDGSSVPLYQAAKCDATAAVIELLNQPEIRLAEARKKIGAERVSIVNIGYIFNNYAKAKQFKAYLEDAFQPYKQKAKKLSDDMAACDRAISAGDFSMETLDQLQTRKALAKKQLEELSVELQRELGKKQEVNIVELWKDVNLGIRRYADQAGIDLVLGYGDVLDMELLDAFPNINRKMQAMDSGSVVPLFASAKTDIAAPVTDWLNKELTEPGTNKLKQGKMTRGVVAGENVGYVFNNYERAVRFKKELEEAFVPFKAKAAAITTEMKAWEVAIGNGELDAESRNVLFKKIRLAKGKLEDLSIEMQRKLGKTQEDNLTKLWKEFQMGNKLVATHYQIDLVLGFGDPLDEKTRDSLPNIQRKMTALEGGAAVLLFMTPDVDLGHAVTGTLNRWVREP